MKLDSRILPGKTYLDCFDTETAKQFIGKKCYFTTVSSRFENLEYLRKATLTDVSDDYDACYGSEEIGIHRWDYAHFIIPCEWVKEKESEKNYRPYAVMEFIKHYPIGSHLHFRPKDKTIEMHRLIDGYNDCKNGAGTLFMCGMMFSMQELYDNYEIFRDGNWEPFGVIDGQGMVPNNIIGKSYV